jgi:hypothetical protein
VGGVLFLLLLLHFYYISSFILFFIFLVPPLSLSTSMRAHTGPVCVCVVVLLRLRDVVALSWVEPAKKSKKKEPERPGQASSRVAGRAEREKGELTECQPSRARSVCAEQRSCAHASVFRWSSTRQNSNFDLDRAEKQKRKPFWDDNYNSPLTRNSTNTNKWTSATIAISFLLLLLFVLFGIIGPFLTFDISFRRHLEVAPRFIGFGSFFF